jgi:L-ornithine Nalpha-acyltransferase
MRYRWFINPTSKLHGSVTISKCSRNATVPKRSISHNAGIFQSMESQKEPSRETLRFNNLEVRMADSALEIDAAQALRYQIFYDEMGATPSPRNRKAARDTDPYDEICDHLIVVDLAQSRAGAPCVVGAYRLLRGGVANEGAGFYSEGEFDLGELLTRPGEIMELGRSCIDAAYRKRGAMQLLWRGVADYVFRNDIDIMFGCGSIHGVDPVEARRVLSYLHHYHGAPFHLRPKALAHRHVAMDALKKEAIDPDAIQAELPPLLKGYLRLGAYVGDGAVIDRQFNTIDVCVVLETHKVTAKYLRHFSRDQAKIRLPAAVAAMAIAS